MSNTRFNLFGVATVGLSTLVAACGGGGVGGGGGASANGSGGTGPAAGTGGAASGTGGAGPAIIDQNGDGRPDCVPGIAPTSQVPRLKAREYDATIRDLVGVTGLAASNNDPPSSLLATDQGGALSDLGWSSYQTVAGMIAEQVMADATAKAKFISCDAAEAGCIDSTITAFGRRAFRRPLLPEEVTLFQALNNAELTETGTPDEIAELVLYGFLVSPNFLMRTELGQTAAGTNQFALSSHEVASRLSYMLWGSMPDPTLDAAADGGELATKDQLLAQATRMLADDRARDMVKDFHREYLHIKVNSRWDTFVKDPELYPEFNAELRAPLTAEIEMFFDSIVFGGGSFQDLLLSTSGFVNAETAALYDVAGAGLGTELSPIDLPGRPGFLTRVGWLSAYSAAYRTSPIVRGAFIVKDVLGQPMAAPPPGAAQTPLPDDPALDTNRKRVSAQTAGGDCVSCHHQYINPHGFVLEAFDTLGRPQTQEVDTGATIDTTADVWIDGTTVPISEPTALMTAIANSTDAQYYYAQKWVGYAYDRTPNSQDACVVETLSASIAEGGYGILDLISDLTKTETFTVRAVATGVSP
jgi:hypothetical protein